MLIRGVDTRRPSHHSGRQRDSSQGPLGHLGSADPQRVCTPLFDMLDHAPIQTCKLARVSVAGAGAQRSLPHQSVPTHPPRLRVHARRRTAGPGRRTRVRAAGRDAHRGRGVLITYYKLSEAPAPHRLELPLQYGFYIKQNLGIPQAIN